MDKIYGKRPPTVVRYRVQVLPVVKINGGRRRFEVSHITCTRVSLRVVYSAFVSPAINKRRAMLTSPYETSSPMEAVWRCSRGGGGFEDVEAEESGADDDHGNLEDHVLPTGPTAVPEPPVRQAAVRRRWERSWAWSRFSGR